MLQGEQQYNSIAQIDQILSENAQFLQEWSELITVAGRINFYLHGVFHIVHTVSDPFPLLSCLQKQ